MITIAGLIDGNIVTSGKGGGIYMKDSTSNTISAAMVNNHVGGSLGFGGALAMWGCSVITVTGGFTNNTAQMGGYQVYTKTCQNISISQSLNSQDRFDE